MTAPDIPADRSYTAEHEWAQSTAAGVVRVGITAFAQESLGDIVYVDLPEVGVTLTVGQTFGEVESTKSVSDLYAPIAGTVLARNDALDQTPELLNTDPYGAGWIVDIGVEDPGVLAGLLDAPAYAAIIDPA